MPESAKTRKTSGTSSESATSQKIPHSYEEFLMYNKLTDWPAPLTSEGPLDVEGNNLGFGKLADIRDDLSTAAPADLSAFDDLATRLDNVENLLNKYADSILVLRSDKPHYSESMEKTFLTETGEDERQERVRRKTKHQVSIHDIKKRSVDHYNFPGFMKNELTELPSQLEAPQILNEVTKVQDFNSGFKTFWQKVFLSEASVAIMQDLFWYYFIEKFDPSQKEEKAKLFDRIADSFVALFFSVNPEVKDKFFQVYPDCLAQAIYVTFCQSFPESTKNFDEKFIDDLLNTCVEWIAGVKPVPESWRRWNVGRLVQPPEKREEQKTEVKSSAAAAVFYGGAGLSLDMEGFNSIINHLDHPERRRSIISQAKVNSARSNHASKQSFNYDDKGRSRMDNYSHPIGPGAQFETVSFDTLGRSALVDHFLKQRGFQGGKSQLNVKRTQIAKLPPKSQTYQELIAERRMKSEILSRQYQQTVVENEEEIFKIKKQNARMNREMNNISRQVLFNKNPVDIKIMSERVLDLRERQTAPNMPVKETSTSDDDDSIYKDISMFQFTINE